MADPDWGSLALRAYAALTKQFGARHDLLRGGRAGRRGWHLWRPAGRHYATLWPFSQAVRAALDLHGVATPTGRAGVAATRTQPRAGAAVDDGEVVRRCDALGHYWDPAAGGYGSAVGPPLGRGGDLYYDDNAWVALALVQRFAMTGHRPSLARAEAVFDLLARAWDTDPHKPAPGGVPWTAAPGHSGRNTVSTGPAAQLGAHLYLHTGTESYLEWAERMEAWVTAWLRGEDGLYADHIDREGRVEPTRWSYNQGTMVAANALLHQASGRPEHLDRARQVASAALRHYGDDGLAAQPLPFNAIFFSDLLVLHSIDPDPCLPDSLRSYAVNLAEARLDRDAMVSGRPHLLVQAAAVRVLALAAWPPDRYHLLG